MDTFGLIITTQNEAFNGDSLQEVARILEKLASDLRNGKEVSKLVDINGNTVGKVQYGK